jgi:hypothetical protein
MSNLQHHQAIDMSGNAVRERIQTVAQLESFYREKISKVRFLDEPASPEKVSVTQENHGSVDMSPDAVFKRIHQVFELEYFYRSFLSKLKPADQNNEATNGKGNA